MTPYTIFTLLLIVNFFIVQTSEKLEGPAF